MGKPKWARIRTITGGSSIAAMIFKGPPHCGHGQFGNTLKMLALIAMSGNARQP